MERWKRWIIEVLGLHFPIFHFPTFHPPAYLCTLLFKGGKKKGLVGLPVFYIRIIFITRDSSPCEILRIYVPRLSFFMSKI